MGLYKKVKGAHFKLIKRGLGVKHLPWLYYKFAQLFLNTFFKNRRNVLSPEESDLDHLFENSILLPEIQEIVKLDVSNKWTLDGEVLNFTWNEVSREAPEVILEFGSGVSTKLFIHYFRKHPQKKFSLITIDQDQGYLEKTSSGLSIPTNVNFFPLHCKLNDDGYSIDDQLLKNIIELTGNIEMVMIDGPSGGWMIRKNTLLSILGLCKIGARWYLDDAFRDSEMEILRNWKKNKRINVKGIVNIGKGLGVGCMK